MRIFIDDGSTHIKMLWEHNGQTYTHVSFNSFNSFKRGWPATLGTGQALPGANKRTKEMDHADPEKEFVTVTTGGLF